MQLFEFEDLDWWPPALRNYLTELLSYLLTHDRTYAPIVSRLADAIRRTQSRQVIDFCSGSGGPSLTVFDGVNAQLDEPVALVLSDKYPNLRRLEQVTHARPNCSFMPRSVDVLDPWLDSGPDSKPAFRTMFTALHHFGPRAVRQIIGDAVASGAGIGLFEFTERRLAHVLASLCVSPMLSMATTVALRPVTVRRMVWTYVIPVVPVTFAWDGFVSSLRSYGPAELEAIVGTVAGSDRYDWDIGRTPIAEHGLPFRITYLIGTPN